MPLYPPNRKASRTGLNASRHNPAPSSRLLSGFRRLLGLTLATVLVSAFLPQAALASASTAIEAGRNSLKLRTPVGLRAAMQSFKSALTLEPSNLEANFLYAMTLLTLEQESPEFQQQITALGGVFLNPNVYDFEVQVPVDADGVFKPAAGALSSSTIAYLSGKERLLDEALACLEEFGTDAASRSFEIRLTAAETSLADVWVDYADVLILRSLFKAGKAALDLVSSYNFNAEYQRIYQLIKEEPVTPQSVLAAFPDLLKFADKNRRNDIVTLLVAANKDYQEGYTVSLTRAAPPPYGSSHFFEIVPEDRVTAANFARELARIISELEAASWSTLPEERFYPWFLHGLVVNTRAFLESDKPLRNFAPTKFAEGFPTRDSWPDESFGGLLPQPASRGILLDEFDLVIGQLFDTDGDGLSNSWERGYGRYEVMRGEGQFGFVSAQWEARARGGHLATFTSQAEWDFFRKRNKAVINQINQRLYIGLQYTDRWSWLTRENGGFANWGVGIQPFSTVVISPDDDELWWQTYPYYAGFHWDQDSMAYLGSLPPETLGYVLEKGYATDPLDRDSDSDGFDDGYETTCGTDPNSAFLYPLEPPRPPVITSPKVIYGRIGVPISYQITTSGVSPSSFDATGIPNGLDINRQTGVISGTPTAEGTSRMSLSATNTAGTSASQVTLRILPPPQPEPPLPPAQPQPPLPPPVTNPPSALPANALAQQSRGKVTKRPKGRAVKKPRIRAPKKPKARPVRQPRARQAR